MQMKKILCGMIAAMMLGSLAGCANENSSTGEASVTEILNAESSEAGTTAEADSNAETTAPADESSADSGDEQSDTEKSEDVSDADRKAAQAVLETFLDSAMKGDREKMLSVTNFDAYTEGMKRFLEEDDADDMEDLVAAILETFGHYDGFEILSCARDEDERKEYNEYIQRNITDLDDEIAEMDTSDPDYEESKAFIEWIKTVFVPYEDMLVFTVRTTAGDEADEDEISIAKIGGEWIMDVNFMDTMAGYVEESESVAAAVTAKSLYNAINASLVDIDAENATENDVLKLLEGEYQFSGDDFEDVKQVDEPKTKEEAVETLKYKITVYFSDVTELTELKFEVKDGCCTATAVGFEGEDDIVYAGYPADSDSEEGFASLDEAFEAAKKIN